MKRLTVQEASNVALSIERYGVDHDRSIDGWGVPDDCIVVFRNGNMTCYLPVLPEHLTDKTDEETPQCP